MRTRTIVALTLAAAAGASVLGALAVVYGGLYDISATRQHLQPTYTWMEAAMRQSVRLRARDIDAPPLDDAALIARGARCYQAKCVQCHGGPGVAQGDIGQGMQPLPGPLVDANRRWQPRELYWITRHGIKMSGMPAWERRLSEPDLWAVVAFVHALPQMTPARYAELAGTQWAVTSSDGVPSVGEAMPCGPAQSARDAPPEALAPAERGRRALYQYACIACHSIPGTVGAHPHVGPPLAGIARRTRIAGVLEHTPDNMVRWLRETQAVKPGTAMPTMGVTERDARDIAAYLATLD